MSRTLRVAVVVACAAAACAAIACSAVLNIEDRSLDPGVDAGGSSSGGDASSGSSSGGPATLPDGDMGRPDATMDVVVSGPEAGMEAATSRDTGGNPPTDAMRGADSDAADADAADAGSTIGCTDVTADPHNCGRCGHDCLGGACVASVCKAFALVPTTAAARPFGLTQDTQYLYWTDTIDAVVYKTDKVSGVTTMMWQGDTFPQPITADDQNVYWGDVDGVWRCPKTGCTLGPAFLAGTPNVPFSVAVDDRNIYWIDQASSSGSIFSAPKGAVDAGRAPLWSSNSLRPWYLVTDGQKVYFTVSDGFLHIVGVDGGVSTSIGSADSNGSLGVAMQAGELFWTVFNPSQGAVWGAATSALAASPLAVQQTLPIAVASDGTTLYWLNSSVSNNGVLRSCAIASCASPATLATLLQLPRAVVVDDTAVYFADEGNGTSGAIYKLAK